MKKKKNKTKLTLSTIHQKIRRAKFVSYKSEERKNFKYPPVYRLNIKFSNMFTCWKRRFNSIIQKPRLWTSQVDWSAIRSDLIEWIFEAVIEGFIANFVTHFILGWEFNPMIMFAHGFAIKQGLSIYWRLRKNGPTSKIPKKNE